MNDVQEEAYVHVIGLPRGVDPWDRTTRGICRGMQWDRLDSLPLGRRKFTTLF